MRKRSSFSVLRLISAIILLTAVILTAFLLIRFSRERVFLPDGLRIAGIPVGALDRQQATQRLLEAYSVPVELRYNDSIIHLDPQIADFQLNLDRMLAAAELQRTQTNFWQDFWEYVWGRTNPSVDIPLSASFSEARLRTHLEEIAKRYDQPAIAAVPIPGSVDFQPGQPGMALNIDGSVLLIENALYSLVNRSVNLPLERVDPARPPFSNLEILLKQTLTVNNFDGLAGIYLEDLQTGQAIHFAWQTDKNISIQPDIAFTASSIIKIPIMVSAFRRMNSENDPESLKLMSDMIELSGNEAADWLMDRVIDDVRGPLIVTEDMQILGLENTFLAGYFTAGSPILALIETPANRRVDIDTDPDPYSQTTPSEIGMLLQDLYHCAETGGGSLPAVFSNEITQAECQSMTRLLINNRLPVLLTAGLPEGTQIAHKHGWVSVNGIINTIGDAGIVYTLGGDYVLSIFLHHPNQLVWDPASELIARLSQAVYNFYNLPIQ